MPQENPSWRNVNSLIRYPFTDNDPMLFTDGTVKWIPADKRYWLQTNGISAADWRMMGEQ